MGIVRPGWAMSEHDLTFDAIVRQEHYADLCRSASERVPKRLLRPIGIAFTLLFGGVLAVLWLMAKYSPEYAYLAELSLLAYVGGVVSIGMLTLAVFRAQQRGQLREEGSFLGRRHFTLDEEGIRLDGAYGHALTRWTAFTDMSEADNTYLLWTDPGAAVMVPKAAFDASSITAETFRAFAEKKIAEHGAVAART